MGRLYKITCAEFCNFLAHNLAAVIILSCSHYAMSHYIMLNLELIKKIMMIMIFMKIKTDLLNNIVILFFVSRHPNQCA